MEGMKNTILMRMEEPTDIQLISLMKEVAFEAKNKAMLSKKKLANTIAQEIIKAQSRLKK